jgi:hypothetical protein
LLHVGPKALADAANGLGIGIIGPLIAYWFARRFGQGPGLIRPVLAASPLDRTERGD